MSEPVVPQQQAYRGEVQLLRWSESNANGMTVTFILDDGPDGYEQHPFKTYQSGKERGQRFAAVLVPIDDNEHALPSPSIRQIKPNAQAAAMLCGDVSFMTWIGAANATEAAQKVRARCGVQSRAELDTPPYDNAFRRLRSAYLDWRRGGEMVDAEQGQDE